MMRSRLAFIFGLLCASGHSQTVTYSPGEILEKTVSLDYYGSEYIFISNEGNDIISLSFELIENTFPSEWSASGCTNILCYPGIPDDGIFGDVVPGQQVYIATNLSPSGSIGEGILRYRIYDKTSGGINDTITFKFRTEEENLGPPAPWAQINLTQDILTTFVKNPSIQTELKIYSITGALVYYSLLDEINTIPLSIFTPSIYFAVIEDEDHRMTTRKFVVSN